ncbi:Two-component sensor histidine kinase, contains HisKA and HATPase domains [Mucilaginibacter mallensis]|uniref:histidine kinase n=1 Tax=Mucilaginibacter mallensis TaxID=652787 RepID=A0A1H1UJ38_MUCMA|nr:histidine kinase dimerization/phosphoacceptor domain -containing protein [Mucilaginibacter mallensis]SDS72522.1 Two-component sensor histidine kinase, contains HisKA and HATPase domains [Mucilaginibacter mallensis]
MKIFVFTTLLLFMINIVCAQDITHNISPQEAKELLKSVYRKSDDNIKIDRLLRLAAYNVLKTGEHRADLDSAEVFIGQAKVINAKIKSQGINGYIALVQSMLDRERGKRNDGKKNAKIAITLLKNTTDKYHLGLAYLEMAQYYDYSDSKQLPEKVRLGEESVKVLEQSNHVELKAYAYKSLADLYSTQQEYTKGLKSIQLSLQAYQSIHYKQIQGVYIIYSGLYGMTGNFGNALTYGLEALKTAESVKDSTMQLCEINNVVAVILDKLNEREKAIGYFKNALQIAERYNDRASVVLITSNIAMTYQGLHKYNEALALLKSVDPKYLETEIPAYIAHIPSIYCSLYTRLKLYPQAKTYADKLLKIISLHSNDFADLVEVNDILIEYFTATKQYSLASSYLLKNEAIIKKKYANSPTLISKSYGRWFKLDSAMGNYKAALYYHVKYAKIKDSLFTETKSKQLKQLEVQYETDKKIAEIKILNQKNELLKKSNELEQGNLQKANLMRDFTLVGVSMLIVIVVLLYRQYRIKQKSNESITHKNKLLQHLLTEKEWLLKEVHHRVKNNLHTVICLLESQAAYLENDALKAIENSRHRIYAMSLIHQKLYQSDDIKTIDMSEYIRGLVQSLEESFDTLNQIEFKLKIDPINLSLSHAIPLGLIMNEAVTNSIKYAFPGNCKGEISISMVDNGEQIELELADNGIGMAQIVCGEESDSLGLELMKGLSKDIDADISFEIDNGTKITIIFKPDALNDPDSFLKSTQTKEIYV